ncbi:MAG: hypothetical protein NTV30_04690, partial [Chloroflexi bacterium]|nr:hypothetical protein [Chloroflexota bacterium]
MKVIRSSIAVLVIIGILIGFIPMAIISQKAYAAPIPGAEWDVQYGGTSDDQGNSVKQTSDGGYITAGYTNSKGAGGFDVWLVKSDANGTLQWDKTFGGTGSDYSYSVQQTADGGYVISGFTYSKGNGASDIWLIKTDSSGNLTWD